MDDTQTQTSTTLLARVALAGDEAACARFVSRYEPMVRAIARSRGLPAEDCDDVAQEVMLGAIDALRQHHFDRGQGRFKSWFKGVIYHKVHDAQEARGRAGRRDGHVAPGRGIVRVARGARLEEVPDPALTPDEQFEAEFEAQWQEAAFEEALDEVRCEVEPLTYQAFDLYARKNRPPREVAKLLGLTRNAVYVAKSRILAHVREKLGKLSEE